MPKVIRDPIWGDIRLTDREIRVVDEPVFQRLRRIRQLGLAHLVYPGAVHTRYAHSLGTVQATQIFIDAINSDGTVVTPEESEVARLIALLHDVGHVPFAHTLEDEGGFYPRHDRGERVGRFLDQLGTEIPPLATEILLKKDVPKESRFIEDMVFNTICADLIDYIRRDGYFTGATGLGFRFDDRLLRFFKKVEDPDGQTHLVLEPTKDKVRLDVITDLLQLLRYRYILTERVTYHHAKLAASAMLFKVMKALGPIPEEALYEVGDDEFLRQLSDWSRDKDVKALVDGLLNRHLHKPVFRVTRHTISGVMSPEEFARKFGTPEGRANLEAEVVRAAEKLLGRGLDDNALSIYASPDSGMTFKEVGVLVRWRGDAFGPLRDIHAEEYWETSVKEEVAALEGKYAALWTAYVFLDPREMDYAYEVERACSKVLGIENDTLLKKSLKRSEAYSDMTVASQKVADLPIARLATTLAQRSLPGTSREERIERGIWQAMKELSRRERDRGVTKAEGKGLNGFGSTDQEKSEGQG